MIGTQNGTLQTPLCSASQKKKKKKKKKKKMDWNANRTQMERFERRNLMHFSIPLRSTFFFPSPFLWLLRFVSTVFSFSGC
jgi:hypothetical protein